MGVARVAVMVAVGPLSLLALAAEAADPNMAPPIDLAGHPPMTWIKRTPGAGAPPNPRMGYEASMGWDAANGIVIRWGGHNQGGGGEQNFETWHYDPIRNTWTLSQTNTSPPGNCCCRDNVFDPIHRRFLRFPAFFYSHGWQWRRTGYTRDSSVWSYDAPSRTWRNLRPLPEPWPRPLRGAVWDSNAQVILVAAGEGAGHGTIVYDPHVNRWTRMRPKAELPGRNTFGLAYDAKRNCFYAFGDQYGRDQRTWRYDLRGNTWTDLKPAHHPPKAGDGTVMAYDLANDVAIANLRQGTDKGQTLQRETWAYLPAENDWRKLATKGQPDPSGSRNTIMLYLPEHNVFLLENRPKNEQQIWTFRYGARRARPGPEAPTGLSVAAAEDSAALSWRPVKGAARYHVYRGTGPKPWLVEYVRVGSTSKTGLTDRNLKRGVVQHYYVTAIDAEERGSRPSMKVRTQPWIVHDAVVSVLGPKGIELTWQAQPGDDIAGYRVERADVQVYATSELTTLTQHEGKAVYVPRPEPAVGAIRAIGAFRRISGELVKEPRFTDKSVDLAGGQVAAAADPLYRRDLEKYRDPKGKPYAWATYAYRVGAVNRLGVAGGDSPSFLSIPAPVTGVYARERGDQVDLKWRAHPARNIVGYNVYRKQHRWNSSVIERLNAEPVKATAFTDTRAGRDTHRYFVAAVDALGQEGLISSPVWSYREWRKYYVPFVGEWHQ